MRGRAFLDTARRLAAGQTEADWRTAAGRAYYALLLEGRDTLQRWGFIAARRDQLHAFVRLRFSFAADPDLKQVGDALEKLNKLRNAADYQIQHSGRFSDSQEATQAFHESGVAITVLDQIDADPTRQAAAIAAIQKAFPP